MSQDAKRRSSHACRRELIYFVMEYITGGSLKFHLKRLWKFDEEMTCFYAAEVTLAITFLHKHGIIHRDVKPDNILLDAEGHCKLTDFGLCKEGILNGVMTKSKVGTVYYMAPEVLQEKGYGHSVDWWSLGITMYQMMSGMCPFNKTSSYISDATGRLCDFIMFFNPEYPEWFSEEAFNVVNAFLQKDPNERLGCVISEGGEDAIKRHQFFKTIDWELLEQRKIKPPSMPDK